MRPYDAYKWQELQANILKRKSLCEECKSVGIISPADMVSHIKECKDYESFFSVYNLESLCFRCYKVKKLSPLNLNKKELISETTPTHLEKQKASFEVQQRQEVKA